MIETLPTNAQIEYAKNLLEKLGYEKSDVFEMRNKEFDALTRQEMSDLIRDLKKEWEG